MSSLSDLWGFLGSADNWRGPRGIAAYGWAHVRISVVSVAIAAALAIPPALVLAHRRAVPVLSVAIANVGRAIPSFAIVALVLPFSIRYGFGLGFWPTTVALVALAAPPMYTSAYAGVAGTPPELVEAARGVGMRPAEVLRKVEVPFAAPLLLTGVRIATVQVIATATLGALVGYGCLGTFILTGLQRPRGARGELLGGALLVAALAVGADVLLGRLIRRLVPWSRRLR